jgi:hypothetical protein
MLLFCIHTTLDRLEEQEVMFLLAKNAKDF